MVVRCEGPRPAERRYSLDHIGFRPASVDSSVAAMKATNVKVTTETRPLTLPSGASDAAGVRRER
jgi:hypothetical protein